MDVKLFSAVKTEDNSKVPVQGFVHKITQEAKENFNDDELVQNGRGSDINHSPLFSA
jgi:hypothetical protein